MTSLENIYTDHHKTNREQNFSILKEERGALIKEFVGRGKKALDIGCRDGALTSFFVEGNDVLGVDIDSTALDKAKKLGIRAMKIDLNGEWQELSLETFDAVVAGEVLEHLYNPERVIERVAKRLVTEGLFIGSVPNAFSLKNRLRYLFGVKAYTPLSDPTHITQFHIEELRGMLKRHFSHVEIRGLGRFSNLAKAMPGLFGFDLFFICRK